MSKILFLCSSSLKIAKEQGQAYEGIIKQRDYDNYFEHVFTVHFPTKINQRVDIGRNHTVVEYAKDKFKFLRRFKSLHNILNVIIFILKVRELIITEKIDIIRALDPGEQGVFAYILSGLTGRPWCVSLHADRDLYHKMAGTFLLFGSRKLSKMTERFVLRRAPLVLAISQYIAKWAVSNGASKEKVRIIYHGVDTKTFMEKPLPILIDQLGLNQKRIITFVGRLSREKYVYDALDIAKEVVKVRNDVVFLIIGSGSEKPFLEKLIIEKGLGSIVKLLGSKPNEVASKIRQVSDINLCLLSGFSLIEAAMSGKPIIAYDVEWHSELIKNDYTGILVPEHDIKAAAGVINLLLDDSELSKTLAENARTVAFQRHSIEKASKDKINCYKELLQLVK